jgi:hypothetical protein
LCRSATAISASTRATLSEAIDKIKALPTAPAFLVHTGDISHLSKEEEWDDADQVINDDSPHRVSDKNGTFTSAALDTDDTFSHTFAAPADRRAPLHPYMVGKIIVNK